MKKILIDAFQKEEVRIAIVQNNQLENLEILKVSGEEKRGNIYKAVVSRVEKHLEAAFIDYGMERHGFLPLKNIAEEYKKEFYQEQKRVNDDFKTAQSSDENINEKKRGKPTKKYLSIEDCLKVGQEIIVQVEKEERGNKGAALTTIINLASTYIVLTPNDSKVSGVSKSIPFVSRNSLKKELEKIKIPEKMGLIVRTIGAKKNAKDLQWCLDYLCSLWSAIQKFSSEKKAPFLIYQESLVIKTMRNYLRDDIDQVVINNQETYQEVKQYADGVIPDFSEKIYFYDGACPLFAEHNIEKQTQLVFCREVSLPSGGSIVLDSTEALVAVDINSAKSTKGANIEETAFNTNIEAAIEVARQFKLRDIGGLIVIDFIDMKSDENRQKVIKAFTSHIKNDRALIKVGNISSFGLLEVSRQRLRSSINDSNQNICPQCSGVGLISSVEAMAVQMIRYLQETLEQSKSQKIILYVPVEISTYLLNEKRFEINELEKKYETILIIVSNPNFQIPKFNCEIIIDNKRKVLKQVSYKALKATDYSYKNLNKTKEKASISTNIDAPQRKKTFFEKLGFGTSTKTPPAKKITNKKSKVKSFSNSRNYRTKGYQRKRSQLNNRNKKINE